LASDHHFWLRELLTGYGADTWEIIGNVPPENYIVLPISREGLIHNP